MSALIRLAIASACASIAGLLTRPCCALPIALSFAGVSAASALHVVAVYRPAFLMASASMLGASMWITLRREGGRPAKVVSAAASVAGFLLSGAWMGII